MQHDYHYTLEEANQLLDWVGDCVARLRSARDDATDPDTVGATVEGEAGGGWPGREHAHAAVHFVLTLEQLQDLDIVVRDIDRGLVDFPSVRDGEEVYLCWLVDEPEVTHWHAIGGGFVGRKPIR